MRAFIVTVTLSHFLILNSFLAWTGAWSKSPHVPAPLKAVLTPFVAWTGYSGNGLVFGDISDPLNNTAIGEATFIAVPAAVN